LIKLFNSFIVSDTDERLASYEKILFTALKENKFKNIFVGLFRSPDDDELIIGLER